MKGRARRPRLLELLIALVISGLIVASALHAFAAGRGGEWMWSKLPAWSVIEVLTLLGFLFSSESSQPGEDKKILVHRVRPHPLWTYIAVCGVAAWVVRHFVSAEGKEIYVTSYWTLVSATVIALTWFFASAARRANHTGSTRTALAILLLLAGFASGPMVSLWGSGFTANSPAAALVTIVFAAPLMLWVCDDLSFKPFHMWPAN